MRTYLAMPEDRRSTFRDKTYRAYWAEDRDIADEATLRELIGAGADEVLAKTQDATLKQSLIDATNEAAKRGVFGAPTWIIDNDELIWGQDRIPLVERALTRS
jgi:2-hydroxychromene-2-carboxylate isomerase